MHMRLDAVEIGKLYESSRTFYSHAIQTLQNTELEIYVQFMVVQIKVFS